MSIFARRIFNPSRKWQCLRPIMSNASHLRQGESIQSKVEKTARFRFKLEFSYKCARNKFTCSLYLDSTNLFVTVENLETILPINPLKHPDFFKVHNLFTIKDLYDARVHYGHKETLLNKHMETFVFGSRLGHLIIDLDQTAHLLRQALNFIAHVAFNDGIILFFSRNPHFTYLVDKTAKECNEFSYTRFWRYGVFTNSTNQFKAVTRLPDLCIFLNTCDTTLNEHEAIRHAAKMCIPTVGIVDTNCNPNLITYPVPGNDDTLSAMELYCSLFKQAILRGKKAKEQLKSTTSM